MQILERDLLNYVERLRKLSNTAAEKMLVYIDRFGIDDVDALIDYSYSLVTKYGEGSAELACEMYDAIAEIEGMYLPGAIPASTATYMETSIAIRGSLIQSETGQLIDAIVDRLVKQASADTMLQNAKRDGAYFAWVPIGNTCPYCLMIGAIGWQKAGKKTISGKHASHIHAHCDCQYMIDFKGDMQIPGYDNKKLQEEIVAASGMDPDLETQYAFDEILRQNGKKSSKGGRDALNAMRRENYSEQRIEILEQKRRSYAIRTGKEEA